MNNEVKFLSPFKRMCITIGNLPTAYIESMSYYEGLTFLVNYLANNVIPAVNTNSEAVKELQEKYIELKNYVDNYFENLDVQEEINNKLDEMADDGTLAAVISEYLNSIALFCFNSVADMKLAENLINGSKCMTFGFYNVGDGGNAYYNVREVLNTDVIDEANIIALYDNTLVAELIKDKNTNVLQFGAVGDGVTDDYQAFMKYINTFEAHYVTKTLNIPRKKYALSDYIPISSGLVINGNNAELIFTGAKAFSWEDWNDVVWNCEITDLQIKGNNSTILFSGTTKFRGGRINNIRANDMGLIFDSVEMLATMINNCNFSTKSLFGTLTFHDGTVNETYFNCTETIFNANSCLELYGGLSNFTGCFFNGAPSNATPTFVHGHSLNGTTFSKCNFDYSDGYGFQSTAGRGLTLDSCTFRGNGRDTVNANAYIRNESGEIKIVNCSFLPSHDASYDDNPDAYILSSNGYSNPAILENNHYQVKFNYKSDANVGADKIVFDEKELFINNLIPISNSIAGTLKAGLTLYQNLDGYHLTGTNVETSTMFLLGTYNSTATIFTIPAGTYRVRTNSKAVGLTIRDGDGNHNYNDCDVVTLGSDMAVRSVAIVINTSTHNKQIIYGLYE